MMAMVISPTALSSLIGQAVWPGLAVLLYHVIFDPVGSVSSRCLICSSSLIRKSSCLNSVAHADFSVQNASSIGFLGDLICECMPAIVLSHNSFALSSRHSWSELENSYKTTVNAEVWCFKRIFRKSKQYQIIKIIQQAVFISSFLSLFSSSSSSFEHNPNLC